MNLTSLEEGNIAHPGVGPMSKNDEITYHAYYQWVPFALFFQALLFYLPHYIWRSKEGWSKFGHQLNLILYLDVNSVFVDIRRTIADAGLRAAHGLAFPKRGASCLQR